MRNLATRSGGRFRKGQLKPTLPVMAMLYNGGSLGTIYQLGSAISLDGVTWIKQSAQYTLGQGSGWESNLIKDPCMLRLAPTDYRLWYSGYDGSHFQIGYATGSSVGAWVKSGSNPVLSRGGSGAWDEFGVAFATVLYEPSDVSRPFKMWYMGSSVAVPAALKVGYAYSLDGISWTKSSANPVMTVGAGGSYDAVGVIPGYAMKVGSTYYLYYQGVPLSGAGYSGAQACLATFTDPEVAYTKSANNPLLSPATAKQALTANLTSGTPTVTVAATAAFHVGEPCLLFDPSNNNQADVKILSIDSGTQITLTANVAATWTTAHSCSIRSAYWGSINGRTVLPLSGGGYVMHGVAYQQFADSPSSASPILTERSIAATSSALDSGWSFDYTRGLLLPLGSWDSQSAENPSVVAL